MRTRDFDARLAERALREAWPVPEDRKAELVAKLIDVSLADDTPARERVSAIKRAADGGSAEHRGDPDGAGVGLRRRAGAAGGAAGGGDRWRTGRR